MMYHNQHTGATVLEMLVEYFFDGSEDTMCEHVECAYKKFLVVKMVETLAVVSKGKTMEKQPSRWEERCQPTHLLDLFWHAHMLHPKNY